MALTDHSLDRRKFLQLSAAAGVALLAPRSSPAQDTQPATGVVGMAAQPLEVVRFGIVGVGGRGTTLLKDFLNCPGVQCRAVCDTRESAAVNAKGIVKSKAGSEPELYTRG